MRKHGFIFQDAWGGRWRIFKTISLAAAGITSAACLIFVISLLINPEFASPNPLATLKKSIRAYGGPGRGLLSVASGRSSEPLPPQAASRKSRAAAPLKNQQLQIRAAFLDGWDEAAIESLRQHEDELTHICPSWLSFTDTGEGLVVEEDSDIGGLAGESQAKLMPVLSNLRGNDRIPEAVEELALAGDGTKQEFISALADKLEEAGAAGVTIDWQEVEQGSDKELGELVSAIADGLRSRGLQTWLCVTPDATFFQWDFDALSRHVDRFVAEIHDENGPTDKAGPVASQDWFDGWLEVIARSGNPGKWIISIACHGMDWTEDSPAAEEISFADAMSRAGNAGSPAIRNEAPSFNAAFSYFYEGRAHEVWFLDAASFANQLNAVRSWGFPGIAVNRLGVEDPGIWKVLSSAAEPAAPCREDTGIPGGYAITSVGRGEVVNLDPTSFDGSRSFNTDSAGRISCLYTIPPAHPTLFRMGGDSDNLVCLTFDDGPDPEWTPAILDILKARGVKAMFFVLGSEAEKFPDLVRRIAAEGHEIGNHSYTHTDLARVPEALVKLELNANQRLIESLIGKSTALFRPPYDADAHPTGLDGLAPLRVAQSLGYMTVLENIDPQDWQRPEAAQLVERVKKARATGNIILLHDGGGDRSATVEALPGILDYLQERGDRIVTIGELVGIDEKELMPPLAEKNDVAYIASGTGFGVIRLMGRALKLFLVAASLMVIARTLLVVALAFVHRRKTAMPASATPPVSVVIPAFNEEKVITQTVGTMLGSDYPGLLEVLVVDDGSSDGTSAAVGKIRDPRVRLIRQANAGKARALQNAVAHTMGDILVFADADTQFDRSAVSRLVAAFKDDRIGAVSGQARVGNLRTFVARCQELEYACNFNLDRRAYAAWNCITVVPGAISAIRRKAIDAAGGFSRETLAEDTDLTLAIHRAGYRVEYAADALAYTEAPETLGQLAKQRFRWAFGTLQCVWKHRDLTFNPKFKALGWFSLPSIWFFQVLLVALSPLIDLLFLWSLLLGRAGDILPYFLAFVLCDLVLAMVAVRFERLPWTTAFRIIPQRFLYRPLFSYVIWKSLLRAVRGARVGWGKLPRTASVSAT